MTATTDFELPTAGPGVLAPNALRDPKARERHQQRCGFSCG
jgi:hypothetical protein